MANLNYGSVPVDYMMGAVKRYIENRIPPGDFLTAVICNDLREAFGRADVINRAAMFEWISWFWNEAPHNCWGSPGAMKAWLEPENPTPADPKALEFYAGEQHARGLELAKALSTCITAMNPPDKGGISMHEWNERLKAATKQAAAVFDGSLAYVEAECRELARQRGSVSDTGQSDG